ncbi:MAG TPA: hypothetical protein PKU87_04775 [Candidatus Atribacteria bacterium]|nr:hypothetical protein [Candidatus Atribacteria bacterium]HPU08215.1 hypothetical protein [Candidatus Atribacteria bacterium]HQE25386.1 hypothetical protein [Candidatus Atribacteria bacterium]
MLRNILAILGAIFLIILAFRFFPGIIAFLFTAGAIILLILLFLGIAVVFSPILIWILLIVLLLRLIFK